MGTAARPLRVSPGTQTCLHSTPTPRHIDVNATKPQPDVSLQSLCLPRSICVALPGFSSSSLIPTCDPPVDGGLGRQSASRTESTWACPACCLDPSLLLAPQERLETDVRSKEKAQVLPKTPCDQPCPPCPLPLPCSLFSHPHRPPCCLSNRPGSYCPRTSAQAVSSSGNDLCGGLGHLCWSLFVTCDPCATRRPLTLYALGLPCSSPPRWALHLLLGVCLPPPLESSTRAGISFLLLASQPWRPEQGVAAFPIKGLTANSFSSAGRVS